MVQNLRACVHLPVCVCVGGRVFVCVCVLYICVRACVRRVLRVTSTDASPLLNTQWVFKHCAMLSTVSIRRTLSAVAIKTTRRGRISPAPVEYCLCCVLCAAASFSAAISRTAENAGLFISVRSTPPRAPSDQYCANRLKAAICRSGIPVR